MMLVAIAASLVAGCEDPPPTVPYPIDSLRAALDSQVAIAGAMADSLRRADSLRLTDSLKPMLGRYRIIPIDSQDASRISALDLNAGGTVFGNITIAGVTEGFAWRNGSFKTFPSFILKAGNDSGDVAGSVDGRPAVWYAGAPGPTMLFRADTALYSSMSVGDINNRREVLIRGTAPTTGGNGSGVGIWKEGVFKGVYPCDALQLNNQGVLTGGCYVAGLYWSTHLFDSPFGVSRVNSMRLSGMTCRSFGVHGNNGNTTLPRVLNDSNEYLDELTWVTSAGCLEISATGLNSLGVLVGTSGGRARLNWMGRVWIPLSDLVEPSSAGTYSVTSPIAINDSRQILALGKRIADGKAMALFLMPVQTGPAREVPR